MSKNYDDIINLSRPPSKRPKMSRQERAFQFSPFAALTGHDSAVKETARLTDKRIELDDYMKDVINQKIRLIAEWISDQPEVSITYFKPDEKKAGGVYDSVKGYVRKIDEYKRTITMSDNTTIPLDDIVEIEGQLFNMFCD
ncbi:MAG: YolD-like family protein [Clostridiaceae bacterium]|nr:YolD-like family protein [Clostridiaceae bacterium]